jgi:predicted ATPase
MTKRIAFVGSSGTGKTTLASKLVQHYGLELNPVGSRSVAAAMGYASPYDVDQAGKRAEFQRELVVQKLAWEAVHESFVTDRTPVDNLAYSIMHCVDDVDDEALKRTRAGLARYTHIIFTHMAGFHSTAGDPARIQDTAYHEVFECLCEGLLERYLGLGTKLLHLHFKGAETREQVVLGFVA